MASTDFTDNSTVILAAWLDDVDVATYSSLSSVAGTNTITATGPVPMSAYASGQMFRFVAAGTNTAATTLNITPSGGSALGAKNVFANGAACSGGEIRSGEAYLVLYDGTQFNLINPSMIRSTLVTVCNGYASDPSVTVEISKVGNRVFLTIPTFTGTSDSTAKALNNALPAAFRPAAATDFPFPAVDNGGTPVFGLGEVGTNGIITFYPTAAAGNWTGSGTASFARSSVQYNT